MIILRKNQYNIANTIKKILKDGGSVILMSHLGRPKDGPNDKDSLLHIDDLSARTEEAYMSESAETRLAVLESQLQDIRREANEGRANIMRAIIENKMELQREVTTQITMMNQKIDVLQEVTKTFEAWRLSVDVAFRFFLRSVVIIAPILIAMITILWFLFTRVLPLVNLGAPLKP